MISCKIYYICCLIIHYFINKIKAAYIKIIIYYAEFMHFFNYHKYFSIKSVSINSFAELATKS